MPSFKYVAVSKNKARIRGVIDAFDELAAVDQLKITCPVIISIEQVSEKESILTRELGPKMISSKLLAVLCAQFSIVLRAGMPIAKAVKLMALQSRDKKLKKLLTQVAADVESGYSLADSFENKGSENVPGTFIETIRAGEESGTLDNSFDNLREHFEKSSAVKDKVRSALAYPIFLLLLSAVVVAIVVKVAIPVFQSTFDELGQEMPALTRYVVNTADFFNKNGGYILFTVLSFVIALKLYTSTPGGRIWAARRMFRLPLVGKVIMMNGASQLARTLSTLLAAGLTLIKAVEITSRVMDNTYMGSRLGAQIPRLEAGQSLGECLTESAVFPELLVEMTAMGEESGTLESTLKTIGDFFDREVDEASKKALGFLQPAIIVLLGGVIGVIVVALYMPMFNMYGVM